jgi:DNA-binding GntR family transcriptional regulator
MADDSFLRQKAYRIIQNKLLEGQLRAGNLVSEQALAQEIGMSRTPVREAIGQLQSEGLFYKVPRVGTIVRLPDRQELSELYEVREALESFAAANVVDALSASDLDAMERSQAELLAILAELPAEMGPLSEAMLRRFFSADIAFHHVIMGAINNKHAIQIIDEFRVVQRVFEYNRIVHDHSLISNAAAQHGEVLAALKAKNGEAARLAMAFHIHAAQEKALASFDASPDPTQSRAFEPIVAA